MLRFQYFYLSLLLWVPAISAQEVIKEKMEFSIVSPSKNEACNRATGTGRRMAVEKCTKKEKSKMNFDHLEISQCEYQELPKKPAPSDWKATVKISYSCLEE